MNLSMLLTRQGLDLSADKVLQLELLVDELMRWNRRRNLTAITARDEIIEKHVIDSLTLAPFVGSSESLLDIGSGAGFPALPLKIVHPGLKIVSVDAAAKKIDFQRHIVRLLALKDFQALHERVESLSNEPEYSRNFEIVTARALSSFRDLLILGRPFVGSGGRFLAMKGPGAAKEVSAAEDLIKRNGWIVTMHHLTLPLSGAKRCLVEVEF